MNLVLKYTEMSQMSYNTHNNIGIAYYGHSDMLRVLRAMLRVFILTLNTIKTNHTNACSLNVKGVKGFACARIRVINICMNKLVIKLINKNSLVREKNTLNTINTLHKPYQLRVLYFYTLNNTLNTLNIV
ncbi:TPA: hypothetical protein JI092_12035 [Acinetobacter baumannii]|nr:hypothetical protein [Acinetobacter baumannii]